MSRRSTLGEKVYFYHPTRAWEVGTLVNLFEDPSRGSLAVIKPQEGGEQPVEVFARSVYKPKTHVDITQQVHVADVLTLSELHHSILLSTLRTRFLQDLVYTFLGELVIALNPFKYTIPWYSEQAMQSYLQHAESEKLPESCRPHTWSVAHRCFVEMLKKGTNQSIIISGESGSGKTESCKIVLNYLCQISVFRFRESEKEAVEKAEQINRKVQQSSPILEAFGNAKTVRNDNSSRFGKFMEIQFDRNGRLIGMKVTSFLIEKSRVVGCGKDERMFHSFYQLLYGAPNTLKDQLRVQNIRDFKNILASGCTQVKGIDDAKDFVLVQQAMAAMDFTEAEQNFVWRVLAAILHIAELEFSEKIMDGSAIMEGASELRCQFIAKELLHLPAADFIRSFVAQGVKVRNEYVEKKLSKHKAEGQRDAIAKHLYVKLFHWLIERINRATKAPPAEVHTFVGLLDIYGFEDFFHNSFEQFCINLANETLQKHYSKHQFERDKEEMRLEGVNAEVVQYRDNQPCLDLLIGTKNSVISFLDDASTLDQERSKVDPDTTFLDKITACHKPDFQKAGGRSGGKSVLDRAPDKMTQPSDFFHRGRMDDESFTVRHFAGDVKYKVKGFVEKNTDSLKECVKEMFEKSTDDLMKELMEQSDDGAGDPGSPSSGGGESGKGGVRKKTLASQFRASLEDLMATIGEER